MFAMQNIPQQGFSGGGGGNWQPMYAQGSKALETGFASSQALNQRILQDQLNRRFAGANIKGGAEIGLSENAMGLQALGATASLDEQKARLMMQLMMAQQGGGGQSFGGQTNPFAGDQAGSYANPLGGNPLWDAMNPQAGSQAGLPPSGSYSNFGNFLGAGAGMSAPVSGGQLSSLGGTGQGMAAAQGRFRRV